jgi:aminoglycoside 3-N-acetyltransferase
MAESHGKTTIARERIAHDLRQLGIVKGDVVFVHSSLKSLGWVEGGADAVIDGFMDALGPDGLMVVPTLTWCFAHGEFAEYPFDPKETASRVGKIGDTLWRRPGAFRSAHPTHCIAGLGGRAEELVQGHDMTSTFGREGPYRRYVDWGAKVMFLGVDLRCNTTLHAVEDWLDLPYLSTEEAVTKGSNGAPRIVKVYKSPGGDRDFYRKDSKVERLLRGAGLVHSGKVGMADALWLPSREMVAAVVQGIYDEPGLLLCERDDCKFCSTYRQPTIDHIRNNHPTI